MRNAIYTSVGLHLFIFILISITLPEIKTKELDYIPVEIIIEDKKEEFTEKKQKENIVKKIPEKKIEVTKPAIKPTLPQEKPSIIKNVQEPISEKTKIVPQIPIQKPEFKMDEPQKKTTEIVKKEEKKDIFDDMLKNLEKPEPEINKTNDFDEIVNELAEKNIDIEKPIKKINKPSSDTLAKLEQNIAKQIRKHYTIPPALDSVLVNNVKVPITISIREDGKITKIIIDKNAIKKAQKDPVYRSFLEAAERAVKKLSKFEKLPLDLYSHWDKISINFTPI